MKKLFLTIKKTILPPYQRKDTFVLLGIIGLLFLTVLTVSILSQDINNKSKAATINSDEPENGTLSGNVTVMNDTRASGGKYVLFGTAASTPTTIPTSAPTVSAPTATPTIPSTVDCVHQVWPNLEACGWPGAKNTGYVASECPGGQLTASTFTPDSKGIIHITQANSTVSCQNISACVEIQATGVTLKNNLIKACNGFNIRGSANGTGAVMIDDGATATIDHNELNGQNQVHACIWHQGNSMTATNNNCYGINDGIFSWADTAYSQNTGDNFDIENNYLHGFTTATANGHIDGYQTEGAKNGVIRHNTFDVTQDQDSDIAIWNSLKSSDNITVDNNLMAGGGFAIYAEDYNPSEQSPAGGFSVTNIRFTNNKFSTAHYDCVGAYGVWFTRGNPTDQWNRIGNIVLETGQNIDNGNPTVGNFLCH